MTKFCQQIFNFLFQLCALVICFWGICQPIPKTLPEIACPTPWGNWIGWRCFCKLTIKEYVNSKYYYFMCARYVRNGTNVEIPLDARIVSEVLM